MYYLSANITRVCIRAKQILREKKGMELIQVAMLIAIAVVIGLIFHKQIGAFITSIFDSLRADDYTSKF